MSKFFLLKKYFFRYIPGDSKTMFSEDGVKEVTREDALQLPIDFLNSLDTPDLPPHELTLKKNCIVMLLRNLDVDGGLCNGTRLRVLDIGNHILRCLILTGILAFSISFYILGDKKGEEVHLPRIILESGRGLPCKMQRKQFPVKVAFALTINKSQGQTFEYIGIDLMEDVFSHGQLYVAFSRAKRFSGVKVIISFLFLNIQQI